ncbi:cyclase family protein [Vibrio splendidus]
MNIIDISLSIKNGMWSYRDEWNNEISEIKSTNKGDVSTVYRMNLCSHTGSYIETSQHKLCNNISLDDFPLSNFVCVVKLINLNVEKEGKITLSSFLSRLEELGEVVETGDRLIINCGWGSKYGQSEGFLENSPYFEESLTNFLACKQLSLLGVDIPVIDSQSSPYQAVNRFFLSNEKMLLLAPLAIDHLLVQSGRYTINCLPLKIEGVCASLCRPVLIPV